MSSRLFQKSLDQCSYYIFKILFILSHIFHSIIFIILLTKYTRNCISFHSIFLHPNQRPNQNPVQYLFLFVEIIDDTRFGLRERQNQMENKEMEIQCDVSFEVTCAETQDKFGAKERKERRERMVRRFLFQFRYSKSLEVFSRLGHENLGAGVDPRRERESVIGAVRGRSRSARIVAASDSTSVRNVAGVVESSSFRSILHPQLHCRTVTHLKVRSQRQALCVIYERFPCGDNAARISFHNYELWLFVDIHKLPTCSLQRSLE